MIIGKFGGRPFASKSLVENFINKYNIKGTVTQVEWGFGVLVEPSSCGLSEDQLKARDITTNIKSLEEYISTVKTSYVAKKLYEETDKETYKELINKYGIVQVINKCYEKRDLLDDRTIDWLSKIKFESKEISEEEIKRLYGVTKRLRIK